MSDQPRERKQPPNIEGMFTLKVDNITQHTNEELLREKFGAFGEVGDVYIPRRRGSTDNRGYAFVRFLSEEDGHRAMDAMTGQEIDNSVVTIQEAKVILFLFVECIYRCINLIFFSHIDFETATSS